MDRPIKQHIDFLDPIRGIAILLVFVYHSLDVAFQRGHLPWGQWFPDFSVPRSFLLLLPATFGGVGVAIFFVVSGFCIHLSFSRRPEWRLFFQRRFFRIYPPYLAALLFFALVYPLTSLTFIKWKLDVAQLMAHLVLLHNFYSGFLYGINPSFWSIATEVQLYALYPLLLLLAARFGWRRSLVGIAALEIALRLTDGIMLTVDGRGLTKMLSESPFMYWLSWSIGAYVAERHIRGHSLQVPRMFLPAVATAAVACSFFKPLSSMTFLFAALLTAGLVAEFLQKPDRKIPLPDALWRHLQRVGLWSFSLYLLHQPLLKTVPSIVAAITSGAHIHPLLLFVVCLATWFLIVQVARLSYHFCELPSIALGKLFYERKTPNPAPPQTDSAVAICATPPSLAAQVPSVPPVAEF